jgi:hypothetical protein
MGGIGEKGAKGAVVSRAVTRLSRSRTWAVFWATLCREEAGHTSSVEMHRELLAASCTDQDSEADMRRKIARKPLATEGRLPQREYCI